ncbi:OsmC family protein [Sporolactobacillus vineae]|uniref:OsmC family protein n=1 Tax=Sporolactobacillus vineae TaxID=444463 RepID=UPI0002894084|nr:OsmC family protein [Sporolactobacillus vineae]
MTDYLFKADGQWHGSWGGEGWIRTEHVDSVISVDRAMNGSGTGANPDELLLSALSSCFMMTLGIRLDKEKIAYSTMSIHSEGTVTNRNGLHFNQVNHYPVITVSGPLTQQLRQQLNDAVRQAEKDCMIAKAVYGNVAIQVTPVFKESRP